MGFWHELIHLVSQSVTWLIRACSSCMLQNMTVPLVNNAVDDEQIALHTETDTKRQ